MYTQYKTLLMDSKEGAKKGRTIIYVWMGRFSFHKDIKNFLIDTEIKFIKLLLVLLNYY
jgi:hypothetical protein